MPQESHTKILNYEVSSLRKDDCLSVILEWIECGAQAKYLVCANPHSLEVARIDKVFEKALREADFVVPDGVGIVIASKILGGSIRERVTGMDIFLGLSAELNNKKGCSYFFLGSSEENLARIKDKMTVDFPNIFVSGTYSP